MARKRRDDPERQPEEGPQRGVAGPGKAMHPTSVPEDGHEPDPGKPRPAPAPGVPLTAEEYERLKKEAESGPAPDRAPAQEDGPTPPRRR